MRTLFTLVNTPDAALPWAAVAPTGEPLAEAATAELAARAALVVIEAQS